MIRVTSLPEGLHSGRKPKPYRLGDCPKTLTLIRVNNGQAYQY